MTRKDKGISINQKAKEGTKPSKWPSHVQYISTNCYHSSVPHNIRQFIQGPSLGDMDKHQSMVAIRRITNAFHPAHGQYGLFSARKIPPRTHIIDYIGEVHCDDRPQSDYDLSLYRSQEGINVGLDAKSMGNEARFINDYRGVEKKPNSEFIDSRSSSGELRMSVWSQEREIKKGEEILVSYGKSWWSARSNA